jgi:hypothetical protein
MLFDLLKLYPLVPASHHRISRSTAVAQDDAQHLLEENLAEHKRDSRRQLEALLRDPRRLKETDAGFRLTLLAAQTEWLLQALNDIRVGSWLALGCPDQDDKPLKLNDASAGHFWAMEVAGYFEMELLEAFERGVGPEHDG